MLAFIIGFLLGIVLALCMIAYLAWSLTDDLGPRF